MEKLEVEWEERKRLATFDDEAENEEMVEEDDDDVPARAAANQASKEAELEEASQLYVPSQKEIEALLLQKRKEVCLCLLSFLSLFTEGG